MSFFKGYLKERWKRLLMLLLFVCIFAVSFWFYRLPVRGHVSVRPVPAFRRSVRRL